MVAKTDPHKWRQCDECRKPYRWWRRTSRFCSDVCRMNA